MKKIITLGVMAMVLAAASVPAFAQGRSRQTYYEPARTSTVYDDPEVYRDGSVANEDYAYRDRSFWGRHRDKLTVVLGAGSGAAIGGLIGGKKGAIIGAAGGLGAAALYTYKIRNRNRY